MSLSSITIVICVNNFTLVKLLWLQILFLGWWRCQHFMVNSSVTPLMLDSIISCVLTFHFFAVLASLLSSSLFQLLIFVKCHMSLLLGGEGAAPLQASLCACELSSRCRVSSYHRLWKKWHDWSLVTTYICYECGDLIEELDVNFVLYAVTRS